MKLRLQQSVETLNRLFSETAELSGVLTQFPAVKQADLSTTHAAMVAGVTQCRQAIIDTLGIVQMICRVMLEETGEIKPLDIPEARSIFFSIGRNPDTGACAAMICAEDDPAQAAVRRAAERWPDDVRYIAREVYEFTDGTVPVEFIHPILQTHMPNTSLECGRLRIVTTPTKVGSEPSAGTEPARSNKKE